VNDTKNKNSIQISRHYILQTLCVAYSREQATQEPTVISVMLSSLLLWLYEYGITFQKLKSIPLQAWTGPLGSSRLRLPEFLDNWQMKVVRFSALCTGCLYYPQERYLLFISVRGWGDSRTIVRSEQVSQQKSQQPIGNQTCDFPSCSTVPHPTTSPCAPSKNLTHHEMKETLLAFFMCNLISSDFPKITQHTSCTFYSIHIINTKLVSK
jgi:hypothetical protein